MIESSESCRTCNGRGWVTVQFFRWDRKCPDCRGTGLNYLGVIRRLRDNCPWKRDAGCPILDWLGVESDV